MKHERSVFYTEFSYGLGLILLSLATAFTTVANFGQSMVAAPAYLLYLKLSEYIPIFTFGMASYCFQAILVVSMMLVIRRFRLSYFLSFVTAVLYGLLLDVFLLLVGLIPVGNMVIRIAFFVLGVVTCSAGVALMFRSYIPPAVYELFVKELADHFHISISRFKTAYDCASFILSVALSFCFFGWFRFEGIGLGTAICALVNGLLIGVIGKWLDSRFRFEDRFSLKRVFEK